MSALFPELGDDQEPDAAPPPTRVAVGERARAALNNLLGLRDIATSFELSRAEFSTRDAEVRLFLSAPDLEREVVSVSPRSLRPAALRTRQLNLSYSGAGPSAALYELLQILQSRLLYVPFELIHRAATLLDPPAPPGRAPSIEDAPKRLPNEQFGSVAWSYRSPSGWRNFFEQKELYRGIFHGMRGPITTVLHADVECHASDAPRFDDSVNFFNFPRQEVWSTARGGVDSRVQGGAGFLVTDMSDRDVIKGADTTLEQLLGAVSESRRDEAPQAPLVFVVPTCISLVTGDDIDAAAERSGKRRHMPVLNVGNQDDPFAVMFERVAREPGFNAQPRRPHRINLVGMPRFEGYSALLALLRDCGVELGCELLPTFDLPAARQYLSASVQALYPTEQTRQVYDALLSSLPIETVTPPPPFGVEGTREWITSIAASVGLEASCEEVLARAWAPLEPGWRALRSRIRGAALGVIVDEHSVESLRDPARLQGVPLLRVVLEMGFEVVVLQYADPSIDAPAPLLPELSTEFFHTSEELSHRLRSSRAQAFYSDIFADPRIIEAGRQVLSLRDLAVGFEGALASARRLLNRCESPFLRRYLPYLRPEAHDARR